MSKCDACTMPVNPADNYCALCGQEQFPIAVKAAEGLIAQVKDVMGSAQYQLTHNGQPVNLDAILDLAARNEWQPIETAPSKPGSRFLVVCVDGEESFVDIGYRTSEGKIHSSDCGYTFSHWTPLPELPTDQAFLAARLEGG